MRRAGVALLVVGSLVVAARAAPEEQGGAPLPLQLFPAEVRLDDAADAAQVLAQVALPDGTTRDATGEAAWAIADPAVAVVDSRGRLTPVADGTTTLVAALGGVRREVPVVVQGAGRPRAPSFRRDVLPVLTRAGCNAGSCHGSARGKDGFHLSLFGYDPDGDHRRITREQVGRRVDLAVPAESLLLLKATGRVRHGGGRRLEPDGAAHATLLAWLEAGAPADPADRPGLARVELWPAETVLTQGSQRLGVRAVYADGQDRDVTGLAAFASSDPAVARVGSDATVVAGRPGEAWVTARYGSKVVAAQVLVVRDEPGFVFPADEPDSHDVDRLVNRKLRRLRMRPAPLCDDATFLRRATLDLNGRLPAPDEVEAFLADAAPDKRAGLVDRLLARPEWTDLWTMLWAERLRVRSSGDGVSERAAAAWHDWLAGRMAAGAPLPAIATELLTATGSTFDVPQASFFHGETDTKKLAEDVAQAFLGIRIQCAQCHDHPFDRWTQDDYHGFAAFFAQVGRKAGADPRERVIFDRRQGELQHPVTKRPSAPRLLGAAAPADVQGRDRRAVLAAWLAADDNPWFARNVANLLWAHLFGAGLVHEPDDARVSNPPSHPDLLEALAGRLRSSGWDVRALARHLATSRAYQRSTALQTAPLDAAASDGLGERELARARARRLRAEVLLDAIGQATGAPDDLRGLPRDGRAVQLQDGATTTDFLSTFGRSTREGVCTCEVRTQPNLGQALHLLNGEAVNRKVRQGKVVPALLAQDPDPARAVRQLYLRTLSRPPAQAELDRVLPLLGTGDAAALTPALEDLLWALLNSREFVFNH